MSGSYRADAARAFAIAVLVCLAVPARAGETPSLATGSFDCLVEPHRTVKLGASVPGLLSQVHVDRGDQVAVGQVVATLESNLEEANAALARAKAGNETQVISTRARAEFLRRKTERNSQLREKSVVSEAALDEVSTDAGMADQVAKEAILNFQVAKLEVKRAEELLRQRTVRSPVRGIVIERVLSGGEYRHDTNHILTISELDPLNVEVFLPLALYKQTSVGQQVEVLPEAPVGGQHRGRIAVIDRVLDAASGTYGVRIKLPNPNFLIPAGIRCQVRFLTQEVSAVPRR
ncbi:RND family efflux transporter, MFP subunit [Methylobacterium sp. 174MFSha1.1]|nr:RND family efflux transporter, MFP subunit [Methylobacterium sp. 174MFSha1.1]